MDEELKNTDIPEIEDEDDEFEDELGDSFDDDYDDSDDYDDDGYDDGYSEQGGSQSVSSSGIAPQSESKTDSTLNSGSKISPAIDKDSNKPKDGEDTSKSFNPIKNRLNNYANSKKQEGQDKLDQAQKMLDDGKKKSDALQKQGDRINKLKDKMGDDPDKHKFSKAMLDKAAQSNSKKQKEQDDKNKSTAEKAEKLAKDGKKLVESGTKLAADVASGNVGGIIKDAYELAKNDLVKKLMKNKIKIYAIGAACVVLAIIVLLAALLGPVSDAMDRIKQGADVVEKSLNYAYGLGFKDGVTAFYDELDYLDIHYDGELNEPLLLATLFYDDVLGKGSTLKDESSLLDGASDDSMAWMAMLLSITNTFAEEAVSEMSEDDQLVYSTNKIFRLAKLSRHMMTKDGDSLETLPLRDYIGMNLDILESDRTTLLQSSIALLLYPLLQIIDITNILASSDFGFLLFQPWVVSASNTVLAKGYMSTDMANLSIENYMNNLSNYLSDFFSSFTDIKGIEIVLSSNDNSVTISTIDLYESMKALIDAGVTDFSLDNLSNLTSDAASFVVNLIEAAAFVFTESDIEVDINVVYDRYIVDEEAYKQYLKEEYIPNMPEFRKHLRYDNDGHPTDASIDLVIEEIEHIAEAWEAFYGDNGDSGDNPACRGDIRTSIIDQLGPPVHIEDFTEITFTTETAFGVTNHGKKHNGVDINEESANVLPGAAVMSVFDGTVVASTASNDYNDDDKEGNGGWVKVEHNISYVDEKDGETKTATIQTVYGGLDPTSVATTGTSVTKGQQIGVIGSAEYSENGTTPGLHFGFIDISSGKYRDPINIFIYCGDNYRDSGVCVYDQSGGLVIEFPDSVLQYKQNNYVVECYSELYGYGCYNNRLNWNYSPKELWELWIESGARYKNGIAVMSVNGSDRYFAATTSKMGTVGDMINAKLEDGTIIPVIIGDIKSYGDTGVTDASRCDVPLINDPGCYGHFDGTVSVLEFQVDPAMYRLDGNPARWGQEWDTSQKVVSITRYGNVLGDNVSNVGAICDNAYDPSDPNVPNPDEMVIADGILPKRLDKFLGSQKDTIDNYNRAIYDAVAEGGYCSRKGVVNAATTLINYMGKYGYKIPYTCGGGWGSRIEGAQAYWGESHEPECRTNCSKTTCYIQRGLDCAGFVRWSLNTAGYNIPAMEAAKFNENNLPGAVNVTLVNEAVLKPGDIMYSSGHVVLVIGVDRSAGRYMIAEAAGKSDGVQFSTKSFTANGYTGVDMTGFYANQSNCIH